MTPPPAHHAGSLDVPIEKTRAHSRTADFVALTKPRLNVLVILTTVEIGRAHV